MASSSSVNTEITCNSLHTFHGGGTQKVLTRSHLVRSPSGELLACAGDEASLAVKQNAPCILIYLAICYNQLAMLQNNIVPVFTARQHSLLC